MTFSDIVQWVRPNDEIHKSRKLRDWIQRKLVDTHADGIAAYLHGDKDRFFNSLVLGVYEGQPSWFPLRIAETKHHGIHVDEDQADELERSVGLLHFTGTEKLFAIDGQHRVAGIQRALTTQRDLENEEVAVIFVGHSTQEAERTRRLFTVLNKRAKRIGESNRIALDEDDGFAVVVRRFVDESPVFDCDKHVAFAQNAAVPTGDEYTHSITSVIALYGILQDLYPFNARALLPKKKDFKDARPNDDDLNRVYDEFVEYWRTLVSQCREYRGVLARKSKVLAESYRRSDNNHLLFRPIGQRAFAGAVQVLLERGRSTSRAVKCLASTNPWINEATWHNVLWDPLAQKMLPNRLLAESHLLAEVNENARSDAAQARLAAVRRSTK